MSTQTSVSPLIVVLGETASGKSALAMDLALRFDGALICADSRTVYRGMDVGTAKPTLKDRQLVQHYCLDVVDPSQRFTVADFKRQAATAIDEITAAGKLPIVVGGTGLYIDALIYDFDFRGPADLALRAELDGLSVDQLQAKLREQGIPLPANQRNPRHLVRALESGGKTGGKAVLRQNTLLLGLMVELEVLEQRIIGRVDAMVDDGFVDEVRTLVEKYGNQVEAMRAPGYMAFQEYLKGIIDLEEAKRQFVQNDLRLAKRQRTWFRRNKSIHWLATDEKSTKSVDLVTTLLNK